MSVFHLRHQLGVIRSLASMLFGSSKGAELPATPGPMHYEEVPPRSESMVQAYQAFCGGDPQDSKLPPHLFPQWGFPLMVQLLRGVDLPLKRVLNQGCTLSINGDLPLGNRLYLSNQLTKLEADEYRAKVTQRITTGLAPGGEEIVAEVHSYFPLKRRPKDSRSNRSPRTEPAGLKPVGSFAAPAGSGFRYACLTGDLNPIHWIGPAARAAGFKAPILHGFATMALAYEQLQQSQNQRIEKLDIRFTKPFVMPGEASILLNDQGDLQVRSQNDEVLMAGTVLFAPPDPEQI